MYNPLERYGSTQGSVQGGIIWPAWFVVEESLKCSLTVVAHFVSCIPSVNLLR